VCFGSVVSEFTSLDGARFLLMLGWRSDESRLQMRCIITLGGLEEGSFFDSTFDTSSVSALQ